MKLKLRGKLYNTNKKEIEKKLSKIEPEFDSKNKYFVIINNKSYPIKQVVCKAFNLSKPEITTMEAYHVIKKLGFKIIDKSGG